MKKRQVEQVAKKIIESQRIAITSHLRPDGDSICTGLALYLMGKNLGKEMAIINHDPTPFPFHLFPDAENITIGQIPPDKFDTVILLECANIERSGHKYIDNSFKINIDHHHSNDYYGDINWVEPDVAAVGCLIYYLGEELKVNFTTRIANHLYCAIVSDTGSFQFSNTNSQSFKVCYELTKKGASPVTVSERLFSNNSPEKIKLLGLVLSTLQIENKGKIAVITMFKKHLKMLKLDEIDTEEITTLVRSIKGVKVVLFLKEIEDNIFRVSIRSKGSANAAKIAEYFNGGGHLHAAGFTAQGSYKSLIKAIPEKVNQLMILDTPSKTEDC
jgi:bifunctional oligoribonuclease and PAP phosphatase NrnA